MPKHRKNKIKEDGTRKAHGHHRRPSRDFYKEHAIGSSERSQLLTSEGRPPAHYCAYQESKCDQDEIQKPSTDRFESTEKESKTIPDGLFDFSKHKYGLNRIFFRDKDFMRM